MGEFENVSQRVSKIRHQSPKTSIMACINTSTLLKMPEMEPKRATGAYYSSTKLARAHRSLSLLRALIDQQTASHPGDVADVKA